MLFTHESCAHDIMFDAREHNELGDMKHLVFIFQGNPKSTKPTIQIL